MWNIEWPDRVAQRILDKLTKLTFFDNLGGDPTIFKEIALNSPICPHFAVCT